MRDLSQIHKIVFLTAQRCLSQWSNLHPTQFHLNLSFHLSTSCKCYQVLFPSLIMATIYHLEGNLDESANKIHTICCSLRIDHSLLDHGFLVLPISDSF